MVSLLAVLLQPLTNGELENDLTDGLSGGGSEEIKQPVPAAVSHPDHSFSGVRFRGGDEAGATIFDINGRRGSSYESDQCCGCSSSGGCSW